MVSTFRRLLVYNWSIIHFIWITQHGPYKKAHWEGRGASAYAPGPRGPRGPIAAVRNIFGPKQCTFLF